jgi:hypothetical protein
MTGRSPSLPRSTRAQRPANGIGVYPAVSGPSLTRPRDRNDKFAVLLGDEVLARAG